MSPRWATTGVFAVNGAAIGTWIAHIPWVQERFGLSKSEIGLIIVGMSLAVMIGFVVAGQANVRYGSVRMVQLGGIACALAINLPVLAPAPVLVAVALFALGLSTATMDVSMNAHGVKVEQDGGKPIMSSLHAGWAFGGMAGAALAAAGAAAGLDGRIRVLIASLLLLAAVTFLTRRLGAGSRAEGEEAAGFRLPSRSVVLLATLCLLVMVTEGAMADWGGLYLRQNLASSAAIAALAYSFFTAGMTVGRVFGDAVNHRIGPVALLRWGAVLTALPLTAFLVIGAVPAALAGLFAVGVGVANGVPLMFSAAGRLPDVAPGPAIGAVSSMGSLGFLAGPPIIGFLADAVSLPWALSLLVLGAVVVFALAGRAAAERVPAHARRQAAQAA